MRTFPLMKSIEVTQTNEMPNCFIKFQIPQFQETSIVFYSVKHQKGFNSTIPNASFNSAAQSKYSLNPQESAIIKYTSKIPLLPIKFSKQCNFKFKLSLVMSRSIENGDGQVTRRTPIKLQDICCVKYDDNFSDFIQWEKQHRIEPRVININDLRRDLELRRMFLKTGFIAADDMNFVLNRIPPASNTCHPNIRNLAAFALVFYPNFALPVMYCFDTLSRRAVNKLLVRVIYNT